MTPAAPARRRFDRAVVTGGAGFLGSHVCDRLRSAGTEVVVLDNLLTGSAANVAHLADDPGFRLVPCDVSDAAQVAAATADLGGLDLVLHLASPASPVDYSRLPVETMKVGSLGTLHALDLARATRARFLLASTSEVYGDPQVHPQPETYWGHVNPVGPRSVYDEAKRFAEALTTAYRAAHGVDTAIVRIFNSYGPRMRADDGRAIPTFIAQALAGAPVTVTGDGSQTRSVCYGSDTARGILAVAAGPVSGPVNLGDDHERSVLTIARDVLAATGSASPIRFVDAARDDPRRRRPDTTLIRSTVGWRPQVDWAAGLERTVAWFAGRDRAAGGG